MTRDLDTTTAAPPAPAPAPVTRRRGLGRLAVIAAITGPGLVAANAGNDAAGIATYASAGSQFTYGTLFFTLTGFHGLHVLGGIALMLVVLAVGTGRTTRAPLEGSLTVTAYYWHFVDVVWVAMFATIYLLS